VLPENMPRSKNVESDCASLRNYKVQLVFNSSSEKKTIMVKFENNGCRNVIPHEQIILGFCVIKYSLTSIAFWHKITFEIYDTIA